MRIRDYIIPVLAIVVVLGGQVAVSGVSLLSKLRGAPPIYHQTWPFLDYPMYSDAEGPPVQTTDAELFAESADGTRFEAGPDVLGLKYFAWRFLILERIVAHPVSAEKPDLAALVEEHRVVARDKATRAVLQVTGERPVRFVAVRNVYTLVDRDIQHRIVEEALGVPAEFGVASDAAPAVSVIQEADHAF